MYALKLTPHVFQRPGEIRQMEWKEIDFDKEVWIIPEGKMKMRQLHSVPLSQQDRGDIIHLRPSGNAPELRCYTESATPERAASLGGEVLEMIRTS